jgi:hypothetical protein
MPTSRLPRALRARWWVSPATLRILVAVQVIAELCEHPGAEDHRESWQGADDLGVLVRLKMLAQLLLELIDLGPQRGG